MKTYLGIDVGSISTNLVLIDQNCQVLSSLYLRTEGDPIKAVQKGLRELKNQISAHNPNIEIAGVGTTGSARYLAGVITGADLIKNEITAHAKGASYFVPDVRTVIEIGGQDSKIIILENGVAVDFAMNLICVPKDTKIICKKYIRKPIYKVKIGDEVLTHRRRFRKVTHTFKRNYQGDLLIIECSRFITLEITPEHPILALKKEDLKSKGFQKIEFIPAKELKNGDFLIEPTGGPILPNEISQALKEEKERIKRLEKTLEEWKKKHHRSPLVCGVPFESTVGANNYYLWQIKKIKKFKFNRKVYNLEVEEDNSYVANDIAVHNCAAGTGSFLDAQASRLKLPIEKFGKLALKSNSPTNIGSRCTVFAESDMIHKQQIGHKTEDIVAGLCQGLARNFLNNIAKGKNIKPPIVFQGGVSENAGMKRAFEETLGEKVIIPPYNTVIGAFGVALLIKEMNLPRTKFFGFEISDKDIKCTSFQCRGCPNQCEVIEAKIDGKIVARWGDRCGKWSSLNP